MIKNYTFNPSHIHKYSVYLITLIVMCVLIWGLNKGFDITDEGFYLLGFQENQELGISMIKFHHLIKPLFCWLDCWGWVVLASMLVITKMASHMAKAQLHTPMEQCS